MSTISTVLALDLSKTSTGYAVGQFDTQTQAMRIARWGTIKPHPAARATRWHFPVVASQIGRVEQAVADEDWFRTRRFTIAIEANVWGKSASEFQYYLGQEALRWAEGLGVDTCTYASSTRLAFVRRWSPVELPKQLGGEQGKVIVERVWRTELRPRCLDAFPVSIQSSNDAVDGGWIAVLALYGQAHLLPIDPVESGPTPFWDEPDTFRVAFLQAKLNSFSNLGSVDLSDIYANMRKSTNHLSVQSHGFYPYRQLQRLTRRVKAEYAADPAGTFKRMVARKPSTVTQAAVRDALERGGYRCTLSGSGHILLVPDVPTAT